MKTFKSKAEARTGLTDATVTITFEFRSRNLEETYALYSDYNAFLAWQSE